MIAWRSLEVRLALGYSLLLFAGCLALSVALWLGVRYAVTAAVDDLLDQRLVHLAAFVTEQADPEDRDDRAVSTPLRQPDSAFTVATPRR